MPLLAATLLFAACASGADDAPATTEPTPSATLPSPAQPATSPPDAGSGPWYLAAAEDENPRHLPLEVDTFGALYLDWNPAHNALAYVAGGDIWVWRDGVASNLTETADRLEGLPRWSPDGEWLAFASRPFEAGEAAHALVAPQGAPSVMAIAHPEQGYAVLGEASLAWPPAWAPDSQRLAYVSEGEVVTVDRAGTPLHRHSAGAFGLGDSFVGVAWSPAADILAVAFVDGGGAVPAEGEPARMGYALIAENPITVTGAQGLSVVMEWTAGYVPPPPVEWSPDGSHLLITLPPVAASLAADYPTGVWVAEPGPLRLPDSPLPRGPEPHAVASIEPYQAVWSRDGRWIAVIENGARRILVVDAATRAVVAQPGPAGGVEGIAW